MHGASRDLDDLSTRLGSPPRMVESERGDVSRFTDATTMDHFLMAYAGRANKRIVERLRQLGVNAFGLCGLDGGVVRGTRRPDLRIRENGRTKVLHHNHVGSITAVDGVLLQRLIDAGVTPVICPPIAAEDGTAINVDGDRLAAEIAIALGATLLGDLRRHTRPAPRPVRRDKPDRAASRPARRSTSFPAIGGRARVKLRASAEARLRGVGAVCVADGRVQRPLFSALSGAGTWVR